VWSGGADESVHATAAMLALAAIHNCILRSIALIARHLRARRGRAATFINGLGLRELRRAPPQLERRAEERQHAAAEHDRD
jgi:hypothetical protein